MGTENKSVVVRAGSGEGFTTGGLHGEFGVMMGPFCIIAVVGVSRLCMCRNLQMVNFALCELKVTSEAVGWPWGDQTWNSNYNK